jgi:hypothetical protein
MEDERGLKKTVKIMQHHHALLRLCLDGPKVKTGVFLYPYSGRPPSLPRPLIYQFPNQENVFSFLVDILSYTVHRIKERLATSILYTDQLCLKRKYIFDLI